MAKKSIRIKVEADLDKAIQVKASKQGKSKAAIVRTCVEKFLSKVSYTSFPKSKTKSGGRAS